jgi:vacuolar protein sorting-associated protein 13A/C
VTLLTTSQVLSFWSNKLRIDWELPLAQVKSVSVEDTGLRFVHRTRRELDRFVLIPEKPTQAWFFSQVASVVKAFNARKRMDT